MLLTVTWVLNVIDRNLIISFVILFCYVTHIRLCHISILAKLAYASFADFYLVVLTEMTFESSPCAI